MYTQSYDTGEVTDATDVRAQIFPRNRSYLVDMTPDAMLPVTSNFSPSHSPPLPSRPSGPSLPPKPSNPLMSAKSKPNSKCVQNARSSYVMCLATVPNSDLCLVMPWTIRGLGGGGGGSSLDVQILAHLLLVRDVYWSEICRVGLWY